MFIFLNRILALVPARLLLPLIAGMVVIVFYEGLPIVSRIPFVDRVPVLGDLAMGRVGQARLQGAAVEALAWQWRAVKQQTEWQVQRRRAQADLDHLAGAYLQIEARAATLESQFNQEINDADILCSGPVLSERLSRRLDAIGRD
ncbi:MAG: hypothetical protein P1V21_01110 [Rhizobiaceae bacterium]|nr:hypothetical protein [Rhizobiaceae bacterium]